MQRLEVSGAVRPLYGSLGVKGLTLLISLILPLDMILNQWIYFPLLRCLRHDSVIIISYHPLSAFHVNIFSLPRYNFVRIHFILLNALSSLQPPNFYYLQSVCVCVCVCVCTCGNKEVARYRKLYYRIANCVAFGTRVCVWYSYIYYSCDYGWQSQQIVFRRKQ